MSTNGDLAGAGGVVTAPRSSAPVKPRMRGRLHQWSFVGSIAACAALIAISASLVGGWAAVATSIYSGTILGLFGTSALYHRRTWTTARGRTVMKRLDHSMIFLFIAGTYTPIAALAMDAPTARWVLVTVWAGALAGIALKNVWPHAPRWLAVPVYIAVGWVAVFAIPSILAGGGATVLVLVLTGGLFYTLGALCYATRRPDPWPATFGYHEFFHAATVVAAVCHHVAIWLLLF